MKKKKHLKACHFTTSTNIPYPPPKTTVIPIEIVELEDNSFHLIVSVEIDGIRGDMIIDTGASVTVIDPQIFPEKRKDDQIVQMQSGSVTGQINRVTLLQAEHFKIGNRKIKKIQLAGIDLNYVNDLYNKHLQRKIIGLLGCDFCVKYGATIDYRRKELLLNL
ncbi:MAG: retropepsin-like aspartic protease [Odoribacter sp.]